MTALRLNHVSVNARDLEESVRFYEDLFGMERIATPTFQERVVWLRLGEQQLHVFLREESEPPYLHHFALDVDDFETVYRRAKERGLLDTKAFHQAIRAHPLGWVQMYLRDPAGNLVEVDWPDVSTLPPDIQAECGRLADEVAQEGAAARATLYHTARSGLGA
ncbi:MAG: glyoxalase [Candidatus Rokuibacteriota bacterium]|nr:MAG: glyoxalase [Candidatus Rokubacteria bacterium]